MMENNLALIQASEAYYASPDGHIFSSKSGKLKKLKTEFVSGYKRVKLYTKNGVKKILVHRLIAETFIENPENKPFINHINGNKRDNRVENLEWCTQSENSIHSYKILNQRLPNRKLSDMDVIEIFRLKNSGKRLVEIAIKYSVSHSTISQIINKKRYARIGKQFTNN